MFVFQTPLELPQKTENPFLSAPPLASSISSIIPPKLVEAINASSPNKREATGFALQSFYNKYYDDHQLADTPEPEKIRALFEHPKTAEALIRDPVSVLQSIGSIIDAAGAYATDAMTALAKPKTGALFAANTASFVGIAEAAGTGAGPAYVLFEKMPEDLDVAKMTDMVIGIANSQGGGAWGAMYALGYPSTFKLFEQDLKDGTSVMADALKEFSALPENTRGAALYCFSKPAWGKAFSESPEKRQQVIEFFLSIGQAYGAMSEATFTDLKDKEAGPFILSHLTEFSKFIEATKGNDDFAYSFVAFKSEGIRNWVSKENMSDQLKTLIKDAGEFAGAEIGPAIYSEGPIGFFSWLESERGSREYLSRKGVQM